MPKAKNPMGRWLAIVALRILGQKEFLQKETKQTKNSPVLQDS
jgi:hypothetical protein